MVNEERRFPFDHAHNMGWARACAVRMSARNLSCCSLVASQLFLNLIALDQLYDNVPTGDNEL